MSTETTVASVPADDQPTEGKVHEETTHASKEVEGPPSKDDGKRDEKEDLVVVAEKSDGSESQLISSMSEETPENNQTEYPIVVEGQVDHVPVEVGAKEVESSDQDPEASTTKDSASEAVESQADESLTIENVPVEKPAVESVENTPVEKVATESVEEEAEKAQTVEVDGDKPVEIVAIEEAEKEAEKAETIEAAENKPVEEVAIEEAEKEAEKAETIEAAENKTVEEVATEEAEKEEEKAETIEAAENKTVEEVATEEAEKEEENAETIEAAENKPVEEVAIEEAEKEAEKAETIEADENKLVETIETEAVEKEAGQTQAMEAEENKPEEKPATEPVEKQIDDEKPKVEASEADPSTEAAGQAVEETLGTSLVKDSEPVNEVEAKPHEQLKVLLEMERNIEKVLKPEENVATESSVPAIEEAQANEKVSHVAENTEKEAGVVDEVGKFLKDETEVSENAEVEEEKIVKTEQETEEKIEKTEAKKTEGDNKLENVAEVADRELGEAKEVLVKEDVYKDIKENEEVIVPSAIVEPVGEAKALDDASKLENTEEAANESKTEPETLEASKDQEKQDVSVKAAQKQSGGIISKVKQSIVKVKKAIIGKSPSSKVLSPEVKAEEPVK
ncbi:enolase-phosphatase E1 [Prunus avium]|uniref:Enolase-phosphatase E1 n=1 Tax=Prunus avium TaxID=42229 RepID=A0A6P5SEH5_PRUAV|nr:enolase-phosphatase E1 [Prunus avium]